MGLRQRIGRLIGREKSASTGLGYPLPVTGGWIPSGWPLNWWQQGRDPITTGPNSTIHACIDAYAQTMASLRMHHVRYVDGEGTTPIVTSALSRILKRPNAYQTRTDFILNQVKGLLLHGNSYAIVYRNERREIDSLHLVDPRQTRPMIEPESREVFYAVGGNDLLDPDDLQVMIPARDVMHIRLYTPHHPLVGVTPIQNLANAIASTNAIGGHQARFFGQMSRPSGVLTTTEKLTRDQMAQLREAWDAQSTSLNTGGVPILSGGLKWDSMSISSQDSQLVEAFRMGVEEIATAFRVPMPLLGSARGASQNGTVEDLVSVWLAMGLGFMVEHVERAYDRTFVLPPNTYTEFDVDTLMRTDFAGRMNALSKAVQNGIYSPNEARRRERLADVAFGHEPRVQAQVVPLSAVGRIPDSTPTPDSAPAADPDADAEAVGEAAYADLTRLLAAPQERSAS